MSHTNRYTCEHVLQLFGDYLDRELLPEQIAAVEAHLALCEVCAKEFRFEADALRALRERVRRPAFPASLRTRLSNALKQAREEEFRQ